MRTILLARVSTYEQETIQQITKLKEYINSKPELTLSKEDIFDFDESAHKDLSQRKKFNEVLETIAQANEKIAVCSDKIDRMTRDFLTFLPVIDRLRKKDKVELHFPGDNLILNNESPAGDLFRFNMGVSLAQYYSDSISDGVKRKIAYKIREGEILTLAPFGYKNVRVGDTDERTVEVDEYEAQIVLKLFQLYSTGAYSYSDLKKLVYEEYNVELGDKDNKGKSSIGNILTNKFYIGIATYKKKNLQYPHKYETIVPDYLFNKVSEIRESRTLSKGRGKTSKKAFLYGNTIKCSVCGYSITPEEHRGKASYKCTEYGGKHGAKYVQEKVLDEQFRKAFERLTLPQKKAEKLIDDLRKINDVNYYIAEGTLEKLYEKKDTIKKMKSRLYDDYASGKPGITNDFYEEKMRQYDLDTVELDEKIKRVEKVESSFYVTAGYIIELTKNSSKLFEVSKEEERRLLIKTVLLNITWDGEKLYYDYNSPFDLIVELNESTDWGGRWDLNPQPSVPQTDALTN